MKKDTDNSRDYYFYPENQEETHSFLSQVCNGEGQGNLFFKNGNVSAYHGLDKCFCLYKKAYSLIGREYDGILLVFKDKSMDDDEALIRISLNFKNLWIRGEGTSQNNISLIDMLDRDHAFKLRWELNNPIKLEDLDITDGSRHDIKGWDED